MNRSNDQQRQCRQEYRYYTAAARKAAGPGESESLRKGLAVARNIYERESWRVFQQSVLGLNPRKEKTMEKEISELYRQLGLTPAEQELAERLRKARSGKDGQPIPASAESHPSRRRPSIAALQQLLAETQRNMKPKPSSRGLNANVNPRDLTRATAQKMLDSNRNWPKHRASPTKDRDPYRHVVATLLPRAASTARAAGPRR